MSQGRGRPDWRSIGTGR